MNKNSDIESCAASYLAWMDRGNWTPADEADLQTWLAQDTRHRVSYLRLKASWTKLDRLAALQVPHQSAEGADQTIRLGRARLLIAVCATLLLIVATFAAFRHLAPASRTFTTSVGCRQSVPLQDGSRIELNTDSKLIAFTQANQRLVRLDRGEAYFEVKRDIHKPFVVEAGSQRIVVLGTKFVVEREGANVSVRVVEGRVRVETNDPQHDRQKAVIALRGDQVLSQGAAHAVLVKRGTLAEVEDSIAWRDGLLTFDGSTIAEAASEFNRYNKQHLVVSGSAASVQIEGTFLANDVDAFARILRDAYGFSVRRSENEIMIS